MKIACIQLNSSDDIAANIAAIESWVKQAAAQGAQFVMLPENAFFMGAPGKKYPLYTQTNHPGVKAAAAWAKQFNIWLLAGSVAVIPSSSRGIAEAGISANGKRSPAARSAAEDDKQKKSFNRSLLFNPKGKLIASYDKIHLFDVDVGDGQAYRESARYAPGNKAVLAKTPLGKIGMTVCYDVRFPQLYRTLAKKGAEIITVPSAFTQITGEAHWHVLLRARAIENGCYIIAPAQTGTHPGGRKTFGHSLVVDPWGKIIIDGGTDVGVVMADIDIALSDNIRKRLPSLSHDRKFIK